MQCSQILAIDGAHNAISGESAWALVVFVISNQSKETLSQNGTNSENHNPASLAVHDFNYNDTSNNPFKTHYVVDAIPQYLHLCNDLTLEHITFPKSKTIHQVARVKLNGENSKQEVNSAELIAMLIALRIWKYQFDQGDVAAENRIQTICTDSDLVYLYWSKNHINPKTLEKMTAKKVAYIKECAALRNLFEQQGGSIVKIAGKFNLADPETHIEQVKKPRWKKRKAVTNNQNSDHSSTKKRKTVDK